MLGDDDCQPPLKEESCDWTEGQWESFRYQLLPTEQNSLKLSSRETEQEALPPPLLLPQNWPQRPLYAVLERKQFHRKISKIWRHFVFFSVHLQIKYLCTFFSCCHCLFINHNFNMSICYIEFLNLPFQNLNNLSLNFINVDPLLQRASLPYH